jgi:hypothetical protein
MNLNISLRERSVILTAAAELCRQQLCRLTLVDSLMPAAMVISILLRFFSLGSIPPAFNQDEAVNGYDAYSLFVTGRDHHGHPFPFAGLESFGDWASPVLTFLSVPVIGLFGLHVEVVRAVSAAVGVLAVPVIYFLGIGLFRRRSLAIIAAWLIAISPWAVHRSRIAIPAAIVPTMVALTMLTLIWAIDRRSSRGLVIATITAVLTIASYPTMKLYVPLLLIAVAWIYRRTITLIKPQALCYAVAIFLVIVGPIYYLSLADPAGRARFDQVSIFNRGPISIGFLIHQYMSYFSPRVLFVTGNGHPAQTPTPPGLGVEPRSTFPLYVVGLLSLITMAVRPSQEHERQSSLFLLTAMALYPLPGSLTLPGPHLGRGAQLIPLLALIAATGAVAIADSIKWLFHKAPTTAARCVVACTLIMTSTLGLELLGRYRDYFYEYAKRKSVVNYFQYGLEQALGYARAHEREYDEIWVANENQPYIYVLFLNRWPPSDVHRSLSVRRDPPKFNEVEAIGKYRFGDPGIKPNELVLLYSVQDPTDRTVYEVRGGKTPDRGQVLFVSKPI